jgi:putative transposase
MGVRGAHRGGTKITTIPDPTHDLPVDKVNRDFQPTVVNRLWVADITYVSTWSGWVYVSFVIDAYARRILGWSTATTMTTSLVLDALEQAVWTRNREGHANLTGLVAHSDRGSQYTSLRYGQRLVESGITPSVGTTGDSYDNALAETINGLYKTEVIKPGKPWRSFDEVEYATAEWVDWYNHRRPYQYNDDLPPVTAETIHYAIHQDTQHLVAVPN